MTEYDVKANFLFKNMFIRTFQILIAPRNCDLTWIDAANGYIPTGAVQGGYNGENDPLYIGRARHEDSYAVGKVFMIKIK